MGEFGFETDPRALASFHDDRPEIQKLFELALEAKLPRERELKPYEPQRLNERHLSMVMMRAGGLKQRQIARAFEATDSNVSIILNHPDAEYILSRLQAMRATQPTGIEQRLAALAEPALSSLEAVFDDSLEAADQKMALRRAPLAFKVLELNGHGKKREVAVDVQHTHRLEASAAQLGELARALRESREIVDQPVLEVETVGEAVAVLAPGGGSSASPPHAPSNLEAGAPSISDSQEPTAAELQGQPSND